jgi:hypothetical protein
MVELPQPMARRPAATSPGSTSRHTYANQGIPWFLSLSLCLLDPPVQQQQGRLRRALRPHLQEEPLHPAALRRLDVHPRRLPKLHWQPAPGSVNRHRQHKPKTPTGVAAYPLYPHLLICWVPPEIVRANSHRLAVSAHTGDRFNTLADSLARRAAWRPRPHPPPRFPPDTTLHFHLYFCNNLVNMDSRAHTRAVHVAKQLQDSRSMGSQGLLRQQAYTRNQELKRAGITSHTGGQINSTPNSLRTSSPLKPPGSHALANAIPANPKRAPTARQHTGESGRRYGGTPFPPVQPPQLHHSSPRARRTAPTGATTPGKPTQTHHRLPPLHGLFP